MALDAHAKEMFDKKAFAFVALVDGKGRPQCTPVWIDVDDRGRAFFNTDLRRVKGRVLDVGSEVAISATDPDNPYDWVQVRGKVVEKTSENGDAIIDALAKKYLDADSYPFREPDDQRVTLYVETD